MKKLTTTMKTITFIILVLLAGGLYYMFGSGLYSRNPMMYSTGEPDGIVKGYIETMIPRNIEVVDASKKIMSDLDITIPEIRLLAARIADTHEFETGQMSSWYTEWFNVSVPMFVNKPNITPIEETGDAVARVYLQDLITHLEFDIAEAKKARTFIEAIQTKNSSSDGQLVITNSHTGIDTTIMFTQIVEEKRQASIGEIQDLLTQLK
jgi:hypothetical protein